MRDPHFASSDVLFRRPDRTLILQTSLTPNHHQIQSYKYTLYLHISFLGPWNIPDWAGLVDSVPEKSDRASHYLVDGIVPEALVTFSRGGAVAFSFSVLHHALDRCAHLPAARLQADHPRPPQQNTKA